MIKPKIEETINVGGSVSLQCKVDSGGLRPLTPKWYRNGLPAQERYELKIALIYNKVTRTKKARPLDPPLLTSYSRLSALSNLVNPRQQLFHSFFLHETFSIKGTKTKSKVPVVPLAVAISAVDVFSLGN